MLAPGYILPSRKTISNSLIPQLYQTAVNVLNIKFKNVSAICLTTDAWTSINNDSYVALTAHYIDDNTKLTSFFLGCHYFTDRHTAAALSTFLQDLVKKWGIGHLITMTVSDNAPNITAAIRLCNWRHLPCFAHCINLVVQSGLEKVKILIDKVKAIVEYFKRSSHAKLRLNEIQVQGGYPVLKLKQDCPTRWNSTYDMIDRVLKIKEPILSTLAILNNELNNISHAEWKVLHYLSKLLKIFYDVTYEISTEKYVSISKVILFSKVMINYVSMYVNDPSMPSDINSVATILLNKLHARFDYLVDNEVVTHSTLLDPRFKKQGFLNDRQYQLAYESLSRKVQGISLGQDNPDPEVIHDVGPLTGSEIIWKDFDTRVDALYGGSNTTVAGILELDRYIAEPLLKRRIH